MKLVIMQVDKKNLYIFAEDETVRIWRNKVRVFAENAKWIERTSWL